MVEEGGDGQERHSCVDGLSDDTCDMYEGADDDEGIMGETVMLGARYDGASGGGANASVAGDAPCIPQPALGIGMDMVANTSPLELAESEPSPVVCEP